MSKKPPRRSNVKVILPPDNQDEESSLEKPSYTITEGNFWYNHFASLGTTSKERKALLREVVTEAVNETGAKQVRKWKIEGGIELGYPTWLDEKVFIGVIDIARRQDYPVKNPILITISELCRTVGVDPKSGRNRNMVRQSLERIARVRIIAKDSFYFKSEEAHISDTFSYFQRVTLADAKIKGDKATQTLVWLSDKVLLNVNNGYIRIIDTNFFMKLTPIAGRLYELLVSRFFGLLRSRDGIKDNCYLVENYDDLCNRMPLKKNIYFSHAFRQFKRAHEQLIGMRFLAKVEWIDEKTIRYYPGQKAYFDYENALKDISKQIDLPFLVRERIPLQIEGKKGKKAQITLELVSGGIEPLTNERKPASEAVLRQKQALKERGVSAKQINELIASYGDKEIEWGGNVYSVIEYYCDYYDWQKEKKDDKPKSGAWLYTAIKDEWIPPVEFMTKAQREEAERSKQAQAQKRAEYEKREREESNKKLYYSWLKKTPAQRWDMEKFLFKLKFANKQGRSATPEEEAEARDKYIAKPETPEQYQKRIFGKVKYPLELEE